MSDTSGGYFLNGMRVAYLGSGPSCRFDSDRYMFSVMHGLKPKREVISHQYLTPSEINSYKMRLATEDEIKQIKNDLENGVARFAMPHPDLDYILMTDSVPGSPWGYVKQKLQRVELIDANKKTSTLSSPKELSIFGSTNVSLRHRSVQSDVEDVNLNNT